MWLLVFISHFIYLITAQNETTFYTLPRFWTNTGFCPHGNITNTGISSSLLTTEVKINLQLIGALPNGALSTIRIHWLLELVKFIKFEQHNIPTYDFSQLDKLVWWLDKRDFALGFELMGNPNQIFTKHEAMADFLWEDLTFQIGKRYLNRLGPSKLKKWRFESWNEPDLPGYNILHFDFEKFQTYLYAIRRGLNAAGRRPMYGVDFKLYGPAGIFKKEENHPLCWKTLEKCNRNPKSCPLNVLTYHHKGSGSSHEVSAGGIRLIEEIFHKFPNLTTISVANSEADPISGWSTPRDFQADVRYAIAVVSIIFDHWTAKLNTKVFENLLFISHDNAFISYHPFEFSQRTLFAHFRMNNTKPQPYYQFIQKPVYAALGVLGNLGPLAADVDNVSTTIRLLQTTDRSKTTYFGLVAISNSEIGTYDTFQKEIGLATMTGNNFSYILEYLEYQSTDPVYVWNFYNSPPYPNSTVREAMRRNQGPALFTVGIRTQPSLHVNLALKSPWLIYIRMCSDSIPPPKRPRSLQILPLTTNETIILWKEKNEDPRCIVSYQIIFLPINGTEWKDISIGWHVPFLSFHFAPQDCLVRGSYKLRSIDSFGRFSEFSATKRYK